MRRIKLCRKKIEEEQGDRIGGYYGGIRRLENEEEIQTWKKLFPEQVQVHHTFFSTTQASKFLCFQQDHGKNNLIMMPC